MRLCVALLVGKEGLEPSPQRDMILSHARLPIPPLPRRAKAESINAFGRFLKGLF
jgi:hypothetical protein